MSNEARQLIHELRGLVAEARTLVGELRAAGEGHDAAAVSPYLADQVLVQMTSAGWWSRILRRVDADTRREVVMRLLDAGQSVAAVHSWLTSTTGQRFSIGGVYRLRKQIHKALNQLRSLAPVGSAQQGRGGESAADELFDFGPISPAADRALAAMLDSPSRNKLLRLPRPILRGLCQRLALAEDAGKGGQRATLRRQGRDWLGQQLGLRVNNGAFFAFTSLFSNSYQQAEEGPDGGRDAAQSCTHAHSSAHQTRINGTENAVQIPSR